jgi:hypothetical protein
MSDIHDLTVGELIRLLRDTYNAIDLRAILLENNKEWECIYFVLRMTIQDRAKLESLYEKKRSLISGQRSDVQIVYESGDVSDIELVLHQINNGNVSVETYNARIENTNDISKEKTKTLSGISDSDHGFPHKVLLVPYDAPDINPRKYLESYGIQPSDLGLTWFEDMSSCFDRDNLHSPYHLILAFPIYAKILECSPNEVEGTLHSKFEIHDKIFSKSKIRLEVRSPNDKLIANLKIEQFNEVLKEQNGMVTYSTSQDISSLKPGSSGALRIEHDKLGAVAFSSFKLGTMPDDLGNISISELATQIPLMTPNDQLTNLLRDAGVDYDVSTKEFKIKDDGHTVTFPLSKDTLITEKFGDRFYDRLKNEINVGYKFGLYTSVAVLSRKLIENLLIDMLRKKYPASEELYFDKNRNRFHDFARLLANLEKMKSTFVIDERTVSKFISLANPFKLSTNSKVHSMIEMSKREEITRYEIAEMIGLLRGYPKIS